MVRTFWNICKESKIEIPEIQRDYAQGRKNNRVDAIRKSFVSDLLNVIKTDGNILNLDFVFGQSVDRINQANFNKNKQSLEQMLQVLKEFSKDTGVVFESKVYSKPTKTSDDKILIPFDGQQRLTTLFLLHFYIGVMAKKDLLFLENFKYKTRESSTQFIEKLVKNSNVVLRFDPNKDKDIILLSTSIKNQSWFFSSWEKDPTVSGMLVMLDEIRKQSIEKQIDYEISWENLTTKNSICFDYFDIQEEGFDEDLYIKMNARGKGLTDFENFRAWLEKKHKDKLQSYNWIRKIDKEWLDLFWKTKTEVKDVDENFLGFFKNMALLYKLSNLSFKNDAKFSTEKELIELLKPTNFTPTSVYEENDIFNINSLEFIFHLLDLFVSDSENKLNNTINEIWTETFNGKTEKSFTKSILTNFDEINLYHKVFFFSIIKFLLSKDLKSISEFNQKDWDNFKDWLRISRNLIYNSRIDDITAYIPAILSISNFEKEKILDINSFLKQLEKGNEKWINFFNTSQRKEEIKKVHIVEETKNFEEANKWIQLITKAEEHFYFYGQIDFIFKLSENNIYRFEDYLNKLYKLFSLENLNSENYILQCLFFAIDKKNIWLKRESGNRFLFYKSLKSNSRERDENWRILFNENEKLEVLKHVLDTCNCELIDVDNTINSEKNNMNVSDWKYFILHMPKMLETCRGALISISDDNNVRLLEKTLTTSRQREIRSFYLFKKLNPKGDKIFMPFKQCNYYTGERGNLNPLIDFKDWKYKNSDYFMNCFFESNGFTIKVGINSEGIIEKNIENELVNNFSFENQQGILILKGIKYTLIEDKIFKVLECLNKMNQ